MAIGRDYGDVPPIRGTYRSPGSKSTMRVELNIARADDSSPANGATAAIKLWGSQQ
jgi:hypothetical protein